MNKKEIQPCTTNLCEVCKQIYDKKEEGVNSLQTLNPDGHIKKHCAKLNGGVDAVAVAEIKDDLLKMKKEFGEKMLIGRKNMEYIREGCANLSSYYLKCLVSS